MNRRESEYLGRVAFWMPASGWEGKYEVSDLGDVRRIGGNLLKPIKHKTTGYLVVNLCQDGTRRQVLVHRIVLLSFVSQLFGGDECCHGDGNRENPILSNLRWDTRASNHSDKKIHGTHQSGELNGAAKLSEDQVIYCRSSSQSLTALAEKFGVSKSCIFKAKNGETWRHLEQS